MNNVQEVFGDTRFLWFFPVNSGLGDGICFPQRSTFLGKMADNNEDTAWPGGLTVEAENDDSDDDVGRQLEANHS